MDSTDRLAPRYVATPNVVATPLDDEGVLLHLGTQRYYTVNETAFAIWKLLASPRALHEVADALAEAYEVDEAGALGAVEAFARELLADGLIREAA